MGFHPGDLFGIQLDCRNGVACLALRGELDMATAPQLDEHLMLVEQDGVGAVLLDLRDLTFVDSTGLHAFLKAKSRAADNGHRFALVGGNDQFRRVLHATAIQGILDEQEGQRLLTLFGQPSPNSAPNSAGCGREFGWLIGVLRRMSTRRSSER